MKRPLDVTPHLGAPAPGRSAVMAQGLVGSEILKIAADIRAAVARGDKVANLTVGDFSTKEFRIPEALEKRIAQAYAAG